MQKAVLVALALLVTLGVVATGLFIAGHDWLVEDLMEEVHGGPASPFGQLDSLAGAAVPAWEQLQALMPPFEEMRQGLLAAKSKTIRDAAGGYTDSVRTLQQSILAQDAGALRDSARALRQSCADCHADGGVGGTLRELPPPPVAVTPESP